MCLLGLLLALVAVLVAPTTTEIIKQQHQQEQCLALLAGTYDDDADALATTTHQDTCRRLAQLFAAAEAGPVRQEEQPPLLSVPSSSSSFFHSLASRHVPPGHTYATTGDYATFKDPDDVVNLCVALACVLCAAMAAGLTIGLMSLDPLALEIRQRVGTVEECRQASVVLPLIQRHHYLLVTLLLYNSAANEALPLFLDRLVPSYVAVILSVTMVLVFGEVLPSALFSGPNQVRIPHPHLPTHPPT